MSRPDAGAAAALDNLQFLRPIMFLYMDIEGETVRVNNSGVNISVAGSGKPDLDGTYLGITADVGDLSPIQVSDGGSGQVTARLSGIIEHDFDTMQTLHDRSKWQGNTCRIWRLVRNQQNVDQGSFQHLYTGYMVDVSIGGSADDDGKGEMWIEIVIENYLAAFSRPSGRTYMEQRYYDPGDASADATIAAMNGNDGGSTAVAHIAPDHGYGTPPSESGNLNVHLQ